MSGKDELLLRAAKHKVQCTGNVAVLKEAMAAIPRVNEFCTRDLHLEGAEVFGSRKRKPDLLLGFEHESHQPEKVNFLQLRGSGRVTRACMALAAEEDDVGEPEEVHLFLLSSEPQKVEVFPSSPKPMPTLPQDSALIHVTTIKETKYDERKWHIARLPKTSSKACFAIRVVMKKNCIAKIVQNAKSTLAPTYTKLRTSYQLNKTHIQQYFFYANDIKRCLKGTRCKWVERYLASQDWLAIPDVWPVKLETNFKRKEILALDFSSHRRTWFPHKGSLETHHRLPISLSSPSPTSLTTIFGKKNSKIVHRTNKPPTIKEGQSIGSALLLKACLKKLTIIPRPRYGCIISLDSRVPSNVKHYQITISSFFDYTCPAFKETMSKFGKGGRRFLQCKHIYYIFLKICHHDPKVDLFIHASTFSFNEVKLLLEPGILTHSVL